MYDTILDVEITKLALYFLNTTMMKAPIDRKSDLRIGGVKEREKKRECIEVTIIISTENAKKTMIMVAFQERFSFQQKTIAVTCGQDMTPFREKYSPHTFNRKTLQYVSHGCVPIFTVKTCHSLSLFLSLSSLFLLFLLISLFHSI